VGRGESARARLIAVIGAARVRSGRSRGVRRSWKRIRIPCVCTAHLTRQETHRGAAHTSLLQETAGWSPLVDIEEQDDAYVLEAELPGVKRDELDIELVGNEVAITGELKEKERTGVVRRRTRRTGRFDYRVTLPERVDAEQIDASLDNGVLTVLLPKSERAQRRKIAIKDS
jgi:HSP20 family protein